MQIDTVAFIIAVASFIGVILGPVTTNLITARQAAAERRDAGRKERKECLTNSMQSLIRLRSQLQHLQGAASPERNKREMAYGEAYAVMLCVNDTHIGDAARQVMVGQFTAQRNEKLDAIDSAIIRLGDLIDEIMTKK
jgi:hypothetical protein